MSAAVIGRHAAFMASCQTVGRLSRALSSVEKCQVFIAITGFLRATGMSSFEHMQMARHADNAIFGVIRPIHGRLIG
jgi:hypothetical protein